MTQQYSSTVPRLLELRQAAMLSRRELARLAGVAHNTISRIEAGHSAQYATIRKISSALGLSPHAMLATEAGTWSAKSDASAAEDGSTSGT